MPKSERSLTLDIGSTALHVGEFEYLPSGEIILRAFLCREYPEQITESNRQFIINNSVKSALSSGRFTDARRCAICVSGQATYMRFVKLPPVTEEESRVRQIVEYEARQNVPFPMNEVIWDYQLIGGGEEEDLEVMFAVIKNDIVEETLQAVVDAGLRPDVVDFAPAALYNAARANYIGEDGCAMILDIGGRCTNLLFLDGPRFFARAIPIAGYSITQQIAKEFNIPPDEAEILKRRHGFVALGGAYEEPESEVAATTSKIVRNVMTRLHGEINRSINVYRTQQKGNKPTHLYLSGGSSIMEYTQDFFSEKLRMEVSYFNPLQVVSIGEDVDQDELEGAAHLLPEVIGTALRHAPVECPVQISLITDTIRQQQSFSRRVPYLLAAGVVWIILLLVLVLVNMVKVRRYEDTLDERRNAVEHFTAIADKISSARETKNKVVADYQQALTLLDSRYQWHTFFLELQRCKPCDVWLVQVEPTTEKDGASSGGRPRRPRGDGPDDAGGLFGPGGGGPMGPIEFDTGDSSQPTTDKVEFFAVEGYLLKIAEINPDNHEEYIRPLFSEEQVARFEEVHARRVAEAREEGMTDQAMAEDPRFNRFWDPNLVTDKANLESKFVESLAFSAYFSRDTPPVLLKVGLPDQAVAANMRRFTLRVKLAEPIRLLRYP